VLTTLAAIALAVVPGGLLCFVVPPGRYRWAVLAFAPILSLGLTATAMGWLHALGLPDGVDAVLVGELLLVAVALVAGLLWSRRTSEGPPARPAREAALLRRSRLLDLVAVGLPGLLSVGVGHVMLGGFRYPPGWDGMNHAYLTRSILDTGSTAISSVCRTGPPPNNVSCTFYPLAADVSWAQAASLTGGSVSAAMSAWSIVIGPLALVAALYVAVRLLGGGRVVAGAAALAPALIGPVWVAEISGRITEGVGPGLSVSIAILGALALRGRYPVRFGLLAGLGLTGVLLTHTYEVLFAVTLGLAVLFTMRGRFRLRAAWPGAVAIVVGTVVTVIPFVRVLLGADGERLQSVPTFAGRPWDAFQFWVTDLQRYALLGYPAPSAHTDALGIWTARIGLVLTIPCLLASPFSFLLSRMRWARPWVVTWLFWTVIGIWTSSSTSAVAQDLAALWYGVAERLRTMILPVYGVLAVAGACVIGTAVQQLVDRRTAPAERPAETPVETTEPGRGHRTRGRAGVTATAGASVAAAALVLALLALTVPSSTRVPLRKDLARRTPTSNAYPATFAWLAAHTNDNQVVAADRNVDLMTWLYADYDVKPLFGIPPLTASSRAAYNQRWAAFEWLTNKPNVKPAGCFVRKYQVAYLVTGPERVPGWTRDYTQHALAASPNVTLVHNDKGVKVWSVTPAGRACSSSS
jgi:hypothetical protein